MTGALSRARIAAGSLLAVSGTVRGGAWRTACPRTLAGTTWYRVVAINGRSVRSRYGVAAVYAATALLGVPKVASAPPAPAASPVPTPPPASPAPSASPAPGIAPPPVVPAGFTPISGNLTFYGRGWGHGVGLSQYGARGRAQAGQDTATILAHYYQGTTIGTLATDPAIRVLVLSGYAASAAAPFTIHGRRGTWSIDGIAAVFPADARLRLSPPVAPGTAWRLVVDAPDGTTLYAGTSGADLRVRGTGPAALLQLDTKPTSYDRYRGALQILLGSTATVIDETTLETYLRGVVPAEMPASWSTAALAAQAIAARSYAAYHLRPGVSTFDVFDDTRSQVYLGSLGESAATDAVIAATTGQVVKSGGAIADTLFSSTAGGATENNEDAFVSATGAPVAGPVSYLRGMPDRRPDGTSYDDSSPYATWQTRSYSAAELSAILGADPRTAVGTLVALDLRDRGASGRLVSVTLLGSAGTKTASGDVFVAAFNAGRPAGDPFLRSTLLALSPIP